MADTQIFLETSIRSFRFYERYQMALSIRSLDSAAAHYRVNPDAWCFTLVLSGNLSFPSRLIGLNAPFLACLKKGEEFATSADSIVPTGFVVSFQPAVINRDFAENLPTDPQSCANPLMRRDAELVHQFIGNTELSRELRTDEADFMAILLRQIQNLTTSQTDPYWPCRSRSYFLEALVMISEMDRNRISARNSKALAIMDYLHMHYAEKMSLESLAAVFGTNRTSLQQMFKDEFGTSVFEHIIEYRISMAQLLIRNTTLALKEIGFRVGYSDYSQFFREFTKRRHQSPQEFREGSGHVRVY